MERPVLIISTEIDVATDSVVAELNLRGTPLIRLNTDQYPYGFPCSVELSAGRTEICVHDGVVDARSVWHRRVRAPALRDDMDPGVHDYCIREGATLMQGLSHIASTRVMSDPAAIVRAENKIMQLVTAKAVGLAIPETCISNDPAQVRRMAARHERIICKPLRSGWFRDSTGEWSIYTTALDRSAIDEIDTVRFAPSIFQPLVEKACDVRVTIVGQRTFVAEIDSQGDESSRVDWRRTTNADIPHRRARLPDALTEQLLTLMDRLDLRFGAIDLIRTPDNKYVFLEVNPNGQWLWLDQQLDLGISPAVASWLSGDDVV